jgi:hypothetical protein
MPDLPQMAKRFLISDMEDLVASLLLDLFLS